MCRADRPQGFGAGKQLPDPVEELVGEFLAALGQEPCEVVALEMLPESFDRVEVGAVGWQELCLDVLPAQALRLVPARVVENYDDALPRLRRKLFRHRVEECLEDLRIVVRHDEADELAAAGIDRADDVLADVAAVIGLGRARAALHPAMAGARIVLEAGLVAEEGFHGGVFEETEEFGRKVFALRDPEIPVGRLGYGARDAPRIALLAEVADKRRVGEVEAAVVAQLSAELDRSPVALPGEGRIVRDEKDSLANGFGREYSRPPAARAVGDAIHAHGIEARSRAEGTVQIPGSV